jgi:type III secretion system FlhB-like substrate exporter
MTTANARFQVLLKKACKSAFVTAIQREILEMFPIVYKKASAHQGLIETLQSLTVQTQINNDLFRLIQKVKIFVYTNKR